MHTLTQIGLSQVNIVGSFPFNGSTGNAMTDKIENLPREELIARLQRAEAIDDNSVLAMLKADAREAPRRQWKLIHPVMKGFIFVMLAFWATVIIAFIASLS